MRSTACTLTVGCLLTLLAGLTPPLALAAVEVVAADRFGNHRMTCQAPVRLTQDCSIRQGPTRPIAVADYRMSIAADTDGRTILISQVRAGPDHNGRLFATGRDRHTVAIAAIRTLRRLLRAEGICLERWQKITRADQIEGYLLTFSDAAYPVLRQRTVLESEHWLPNRLSRR